MASVYSAGLIINSLICALMADVLELAVKLFIVTEGVIVDKRTVLTVDIVLCITVLVLIVAVSVLVTSDCEIILLHD